MSQYVIWTRKLPYNSMKNMRITSVYRYEEAAHAATRALTIDPKNLEARYVRGVARLEQRLLQAAQTGRFNVSYIQRPMRTHTYFQISRQSSNMTKHICVPARPLQKLNNFFRKQGWKIYSNKRIPLWILAFPIGIMKHWK